jgi:hypothetical protein
MPAFAFDASQSRTLERSALQDVCESNEHAWRSAAMAGLADARRVASETLSGQVATLDRGYRDGCRRRANLPTPSRRSAGGGKHQPRGLPTEITKACGAMMTVPANREQEP